LSHAVEQLLQLPLEQYCAAEQLWGFPLQHCTKEVLLWQAVAPHARLLHWLLKMLQAVPETNHSLWQTPSVVVQIGSMQAVHCAEQQSCGQLT